MRLHQPVLGLRRARARADASASNPVPLDTSSMSMELDETLPATPEQRKPRKAAQPWLGRVELEAAGFEDTLPTDFSELTEGRAASGADQAVVSSFNEAESEEDIPFDAITLLAGLREGDWVDLYSHREWLRAQLIWASTRGTLFMFVSRGGRPHSMTKRSCERLIANRLLRPVDGQSVVRKAIEAIAANQARVEEAVAA